MNGETGTRQMHSIIDGVLADIQRTYPGISRMTAVRAMRAMASIAEQGDMTDEAFENAFFDRIIIDSTRQQESWAIEVASAIYKKGGLE